MLQERFPAVLHWLLVIYQIKQSLYGLQWLVSKKDSFRTIGVQRLIDRLFSCFLKEFNGL